MTVSGSRQQRSQREATILRVTLELLQQRGVEQLSMHAVASQSRVSKATIYHRWPSKMALLHAAVVEGIQLPKTPSYTGVLSDDLAAIGSAICQDAVLNAGMVRAVLATGHHYRPLMEVVQQAFLRRYSDWFSDAFAAAMRSGRGVLTAHFCHGDTSPLPGR